jgi:hypothetical protein
MRARQRGMTVIGFLMLAIIIGMLGFAVMRLTPFYLEYMTVQRVLNNTAADLNGQGPTAESIRQTIQKYFMAEMVTAQTARELQTAFTIRKSENGYLVQVNYEKRAPYIANVSLLVTFEDEVEIRQ